MHPRVSAKTNQWREVAAHAVVLEAEVAVGPLPARRPAFRLRAHHLLEDAGQAVLLPRARRPALPLRARHLLGDAGQVRLPRVARAEAVVAAAQRCRDCRS